MEQTTKDWEYIEPLNILLVSGEQQRRTQDSLMHISGRDISYHVDITHFFDGASRMIQDQHERGTTQDGRRYDVVLTDLVLPTLETGGPPLVESNVYGLALALQAIQAGIPYIGILFDQNAGRGGTCWAANAFSRAIAGENFEATKKQRVSHIHSGEKKSKLLLTQAPIMDDVKNEPDLVANEPMRPKPAQYWYSIFNDLLRGTLHMHYTQWNGWLGE